MDNNSDIEGKVTCTSVDNATSNQVEVESLTEGTKLSIRAGIHSPEVKGDSKLFMDIQIGKAMACNWFIKSKIA